MCSSGKGCDFIMAVIPIFSQLVETFTYDQVCGNMLINLLVLKRALVK